MYVGEMRAATGVSRCWFRRCKIIIDTKFTHLSGRGKDPGSKRDASTEQSTLGKVILWNRNLNRLPQMKKAWPMERRSSKC